jgi:CYTH domain-containing protein
MLELERTFLAKSLPDELRSHPHKRIIDLYVKNGTEHLDLRVRQNGDHYEITHKRPVEGTDSSKQEETTIVLEKIEFESLSNADVRKVEKTRYYYPVGDLTAEFDIFEGDLAGLVLVDFEFKTEAEMHTFVMPDFCLADVTQEAFVAGGVLAGKSYADIESDLEKYQYRKRTL